MDESDGDRVRRLERTIERLRAEVNGILGGELLLLEERKELLAEEVAQELGISPQAANNRLRALVRVGLSDRVRVDPKRGGKRYLYALPEEE
jgi:predicted DNA-binding transcriptional regulator